MKPLGQDFFDLINWQAEITAILNANGYLGLLIDSKAGDLRRSGLVSRPESVLALDKLLSSKNGKIYYLNPSQYSKEAYLKAISTFNSTVLDSVNANYNATPPYLMFTKPSNSNNHLWNVLEFDSRSTCMWFHNFTRFLDEQMNNKNNEKCGSSDVYVKCKFTMLDETIRSAVSNVISLLAN